MMIIDVLVYHNNKTLGHLRYLQEPRAWKMNIAVGSQPETILITKAKIYIKSFPLIFLVFTGWWNVLMHSGTGQLSNSFNIIRSILLCVNVLFWHVSLCLSLKVGKNDPVLHARVLQLTDKTWVLTRISQLPAPVNQEVTCRWQVSHCTS